MSHVSTTWTSLTSILSELCNEHSGYYILQLYVSHALLRMKVSLLHTSYVIDEERLKNATSRTHKSDTPTMIFSTDWLVIDHLGAALRVLVLFYQQSYSGIAFLKVTSTKVLTCKVFKTLDVSTSYLQQVHLDLLRQLLTSKVFNLIYLFSTQLVDVTLRNAIPEQDCW